MKPHNYITTQFLPITLSTAWEFFSSPKNLSKITPSYMDFQILSNLRDEPMHEGMLIDYTVRPLLGIKVRWTTEITRVDVLKRFTDRQLRGPFSIWEHTHTFEEKDGGVLMTDVVIYIPPFGILGRVAHWLFLRKQVEGIFTHRKVVLSNYFKDK